MVALTLRSFFFFNTPATTEIYTLSLHDALPISRTGIRKVQCALPSTSMVAGPCWRRCAPGTWSASRSEEHTSELQSRRDLVCRLLLEKKKTYHSLDTIRQWLSYLLFVGRTFR